MGREDGARLMRLMRDAHDGALPCESGLRCPLAPREDGEQQAERRVA